MRTLKVRAWDDRNKRFGYITIQANMVAWPSNLWISQVSHDDEGVRFDDVTDWQQYTGLLDKNGKEIYDGDIVHWDDGDPELISHDKVYWNEKEASWGLYKISESLYEQNDECEVVGNIHENPELVNPEKGVGK